jgi:hypothetical protein
MSPKNKAAVALGRKGGKSTSTAKTDAVKRNLALARAKRWPEKQSRPVRQIAVK